MVEGESSTIFFVVVLYENVASYSGAGIGLCIDDTGFNNPIFKGIFFKSI
ncbi:hypothetical protein CQA01_24970 [Cyclobacterium qasimii]|uniref:Uncharacterized protein n=1 Tax=Cyclobacterium qasimii TaxID=1350429 RepID=A0A512CCM8_9BACT|nr:hypothetical protein CQA01_24970 [Cyclobacterium qasimii]